MADDMFKGFSACLQGKAYPENGINSFMFCRYLGNSQAMLEYANFINCRYNELSEKSQFAFIQSIKGKPKFIRWIQTPKVTNAKPEEYDALIKKYNISERKAQDYLKILRSNKLKGTK